MKYVHTLLAIFVVVFCASTADSFAQDKVVTVTGMAATRQGAIENGLIQAVHQVNGLSLKASAEAVRSGMTVSQDGSRRVEYKTKQRTASQTKSHGIISDYKILEEDTIDGLWHITLQAHIEVYKTPGFSPKSRRKLAIVDFKANKSLRRMGIPKVLLQKLTDRLVQSRRFAVVDRENDALYQQEKARWHSSDIALEEKAKLGKRLGVDYIVTGTILSFAVSSKTELLGMTDESYIIEKLTAEVAYKVIVPATMQVKWSSTVTHNITLEPDNRSSQSALIAKLSKSIAQKISNDLLRAIYPIKVIKVAGDVLYLNMGGVNVTKGQHFTVYHLGERLVDPYTNESLGRMETQVASATIVDVKPKFAIASVHNLSGIIKKGDICRRANRKHTSKTKVQQEESSVTYSQDGGVKLPFD